MRQSLTQEQNDFLENLVVKYSDVLEKYGRLCVRYHPVHYGLVEDAVQETFIAASKAITTLMTHENVLGWLKVTLHRRILHELRKPSRTREQLYAEPDSSQVVNSKWVQQAFTAWEQETTLQDVMAVVDAILTPEERTVFQLFFLNDYSTKETAQHTGSTHDAVRGRIARIRKKLG